VLSNADDLILNERYRVEWLLGEGTFAQTYLVRHLELGVDRAVKMLTRDIPGVSSTVFDDYQTRFRLEAQLAARLDHPHVLKVHEFVAEEDVLCLVIDYAPGGSLADLLKSPALESPSGRSVRYTVKHKGQLRLGEFLRIVMDAAEGLGAIHEQLEIVHRNLKPSNILLTEGGRAKIGDLGLAQVEGGLSLRSTLGRKAARHPGSPLYRSPEQEQEQEYGYLQYSSDVYSLGCVMFEMLTARRYKNQWPGARVRQFREDTPDWLDEVVAQCLKQDQRERPRDGSEVAKLLREGNRESMILRPRPAEAWRAPNMATRHYTGSGLVTATPENVAELLALPDPPDRVWWEKAEMELCLVPAGEFLVGSPEGEGFDREHPQHTVYLDAYYIGRSPVTQRQYARFVRDTGHRLPHWSSIFAKKYNWDESRKAPPHGKENHPIVLVSWGDAVAYCEWAGLQLPTEAEWEKAARGIDGRSYPWGDQEPTERLCNFNDNERGTTAVGRYSPQGDSPYGCADMAGNVDEWCADWYDEDYYSRSPPENPAGPDSGEYRVVRGGSWGRSSWPHGVHITRRVGYNPDKTSDIVGFRCARGSA
jgi:serine/threonine-protein kinase